MSGNVSLPRVAFWLVPCLQERLLLKDLITSFAEKFSSPVFLPHVTLYSCERGERQELSLLTSLAKRCPPFSMAVDSIGSSERIAQAFSLRLQRCKEVEGLAQSLATRAPSVSDYTFDPHLSLVYQDLPVAERNRLVSNWSSPLENICFDQLWAVAIPAQIKTLQDFYGWQPLLVCRLDSLLNAGTL